MVTNDRLRDLIAEFRASAAEIMPDRDENTVDFEGEVSEMEADTWIAAAERLEALLTEPPGGLTMQNSNVQLACDAQGWFGSFGIAVEAFVADILTDGAPFEAEVTWGDPAVTMIVTVVGIIDGEMVTTDPNVRISLGDVIRLEA